VASLPIGPAPHQFCGHRIFTADNGVHRDVDMRRTLDLARDDARGRPAHLGSNRCTKIVLQKKCWFHQMDRTSKAFGQIAAFTFERERLDPRRSLDSRYSIRSRYGLFFLNKKCCCFTKVSAYGGTGH
jgi:hypothetical protein